MPVRRPVYPFCALVGQERLKRALILNAVNPRIGGVLIRGEKGTAKSTAVRALAHLLPSIAVVAGCPYSCYPDEPQNLCDRCAGQHASGESLPTEIRPTRLVELPVSASEDRVVGALDLEHAITEGKRRFEPGLLAQVHRGLLYVDEVNLLDDHLVDLLLDAAAMGVNTVEREGISVSHAARFMLVGTMNPEEGELRPQLLDRFGLAVEIRGLTDVAGRVAVIERRMAYEADPEAFALQWQHAEAELAEQISAARDRLAQVTISPADMAAVAHLSLELGVDGHRADITILETARTHAAWCERITLANEDIRIAAELALPHRMRRQPFADVALDDGRIGEILEHSRYEIGSGRDAPPEDVKKNDRLSDQAGSDEGGSTVNATTPALTGSGGEVQQSIQQQDQTVGGTVHTATQLFQVQRFEGQRDRQQRRRAGRRSRTRSKRKQGRYITSIRVHRVNDLALDATLREAAPFQRQRQRLNRQIDNLETLAAESGVFTSTTYGLLQPKVILRRNDLRQKVRVRRTRNAVCFVVDASWSMAAEERMRSTKAAVLSLLHDAYQRRDQVGLVSFQRDYAHVLLPLTSSVDLARKCLQTMPTGGKTPLARGLLTGYEVLERARLQDQEVIPLLVLLTDGQANVSMGNLPPQSEAYRVAEFIANRDIQSIVIDTEHPNFERGLARQLAEYLQGVYYRLDDLENGDLAQAVRMQMRK